MLVLSAKFSTIEKYFPMSSLTVGTKGTSSSTKTLNSMTGRQIKLSKLKLPPLSNGSSMEKKTMVKKKRTKKLKSSKKSKKRQKLRRINA